MTEPTCKGSFRVEQHFQSHITMPGDATSRMPGDATSRATGEERGTHFSGGQACLVVRCGNAAERLRIPNEHH